MQAAMASAERIFALLDTPETLKNPVRPKTVERFAGEVEFKNVWLSYRADEPVLKDISFRLRAGRKSRSGRRHRRRQDVDHFSALPLLRCRARRDPRRRHRHPRVEQTGTAPPLGFGLAGRVSFFRRHRDQHHAWRRAHR